MGVDAKMDENGYVTAKIPRNTKSNVGVCFIAHVDTSPAVSGKDVNPQCVIYNGGDVVLQNGLKMLKKDKFKTPFSEN